MKYYAIIVAGGSGSRMKSSLPKQFLILEDKPILAHTLQAFADLKPNLEIILVLPSDHIDTWKGLAKQYHVNFEHTIIPGGNTRFQSVKNGLENIHSDGLVAIHDGARPLVTSEVISSTFERASTTGSGIAAVDVKDSLRIITAEGNKTVDRSQYKAVQTPQTFDVKLIKEAFKKAQITSFTDDASVFESNGQRIYLTTGSYENIKVTTPEDLLLAAEIIKQRKSLSLSSKNRL